MRLSKIDPNSFSNPEYVRTTHIDLDWVVNFETRSISGTVLLNFDIIAPSIREILLDLSELTINSIRLKNGNDNVSLDFTIGNYVKDIGSKLTISLPGDFCEQISVLIDYETSSGATGLQWLSPEQTHGKQFPYLYTHASAIHARSILPCQDTPSIKFTYNAVVRYPPTLKCLMSAIIMESMDGLTKFEQSVPIPSYLIAFAIGKLVSRRLGPITHVWAEDGQIDAAAFEFAETHAMLEKAIELCGPYVWKQYDLLVMPPSFPYGGMENPCLTFVTPTLLAKDRSLATVVAHEIAHSWTGNLVTNKNFEHFWLNEGFTVFIEGKIIGALKGREYRDFYGVQGIGELNFCIRSQLVDQPHLTKLVVDLTDLNPDDSFSSVPYMKGSVFLRFIEDTLGGPDVFNKFLRFYLGKYQYQSVDTNDFKETLFAYFKDHPGLVQIDWDRWIYGEGMPKEIPNYDTSLSNIAKNHAKLWAENKMVDIKLSALIKESLSAILVVQFLDNILEYEQIVDLSEEKVECLSKIYGIENSSNSEILFRFYRLVIKARLMSKLTEILDFANSNFRMKFVRPIYRDLGRWTEARNIAINNFISIKPQMMKVCYYSIFKDLNLAAEEGTN